MRPVSRSPSNDRIHRFSWPAPAKRRTIPALARWAQTWQAGFDVERLPRLRDRLAGCCSDMGSDLNEIAVAMIINWDGRSVGQLADRVDSMRGAGVEMVLIGLPKNNPRLVETTADALSPFQ